MSGRAEIFEEGTADIVCRSHSPKRLGEAPRLLKHNKDNAAQDLFIRTKKGPPGRAGLSLLET